MMNCPLKTWRKNNGISQLKLSELLDVHVATIRAWEHARKFPRPKQMMSIKKITNYPLIYAGWFLWYESEKQ